MLPKTADGVEIEPGMMVWNSMYGGPPEQFHVLCVSLRLLVEGPPESDLCNFSTYNGHTLDPAYVYFSEDEAKKALAK